MHFPKLARCCLVFAIIPVLAGAEPLWVAVGYGGRRLSSSDGATWENDQRWSDESKDDDNVLFNVAYGRAANAKAGRFIAVGGGAKIGHIVWTEDGKAWTELASHKGRVATIAFGRDRFVAAHDAELLYTLDGETFTAGEKLDWKGSVHARKSAFGDGEGGAMFVIIGDVDLQGEPQRVGWRAATADGVTFAKAEHHTPEARDIAFGAGHFVVVGPAGMIESSHDGLNWTRREADPNEDFQDIAWTGKRFIVRGKDTWISSDAVSWTRTSARLPASIAWANEVAERMAVHGIALNWGGTIYASGDLSEWRKLPVAPGPSLIAVAESE
jgi:hypothetical protein